MKEFDRRSFLKISGAALGIGVLYSAVPTIVSAEERDLMRFLGKQNGEAVTPFSFIQLSDAHVGFNGPPDPLGTKAFERAVDMINGASATARPALVYRRPHSRQRRKGRSRPTHEAVSGNLQAHQRASHQVRAGRARSGLDKGSMYHDFLGDSYYSFDHRGIHFIALDNVSRAKPEVGPEQLAWLKKDLARFPDTAPIVVFTHRPLFDLRPEWEWFTSDGDDVMNLLTPYQNVTVLYGHIHRDDAHEIGNSHHYAAKSLIFAFPDPEKVADKKPLPFDKDAPFKNLGIRLVHESFSGKPETNSIGIEDVELTAREFSGINGIQQLLQNPKL